MADHYNLYELKQFAATIAECMDFSLPNNYAPSIGWAVNLLKERMDGAADRVVLYHADAVGFTYGRNIIIASRRFTAIPPCLFRLSVR